MKSVYLQTSEITFIHLIINSDLSKTLDVRTHIYCSRSVCDHFVNNNSSAYVCSIDVSKAFDKISHFALFTKLIERSIHVNIINILSTWYCKAITTVSWSGIFSSMFSPEAGIRQGGILSPVLFAVYVNSLLEKLQNSGTGCHLSRLFMGALMYADDLVLVSGSIADLQSMIDLCVAYLNCVVLT